MLVERNDKCLNKNNYVEKMKKCKEFNKTFFFKTISDDSILLRNGTLLYK